MNRYYIVYEKICKDSTIKSWGIFDVNRDLDHSEDLEDFIHELINRYDCGIWLINWKKLDE